MLTKKMIAEGWIAHDGGPCPVPLNQHVEVLCRGGGKGTGLADYFWWGRYKDGPASYEIIAYKPETTHD